MEAFSKDLSMRRRLGQPVDADEIARLTRIGTEVVANFLRDRNIPHTRIELEGERKRTIFELHAALNSKQGRYVALLARHFPEMRVIFDPERGLQTDAAAGVRKQDFEVGSYQLLLDPAKGEDLWLHELAHIRKRGQQGQVWAFSGEVRSVAEKAGFVLYRRQQSFSEPEAYERSFHAVLKRFARALSAGDEIEIRRGISALSSVTNRLLDVSGRNLWTASQLLGRWDSLQTRLESYPANVLVFRARFEHPQGYIYVSVPFTMQLNVSVNIEGKAVVFFASMLERNQRRLEHFKKIAALVEEMQGMSERADIAAARARIHALFLARPQ